MHIKKCVAPTDLPKRLLKCLQLLAHLFKSPFTRVALSLRQVVPLPEGVKKGNMQQNFDL